MPTTYTDVDLLLLGWLPTVLTPAPRAGVATPADPSGTYSWVPFVRLQRIGGSGRFGLDTARVNVECFDRTYGGASSLANRVRVAFETRLIGYVGAGGSVSDVVTSSAPTWVPYDDVNVSRFLASYTVVIHSL